jgi:hypothetical protein
MVLMLGRMESPGESREVAIKDEAGSPRGFD